MKHRLLFLLLLGANASRSAAQEAGRNIRQIGRDTLIIHFAFDRADSLTYADRWLSGSQSDSRVPSGSFDSICIIGHTDLHGSENYNFTLSFRRAQFIRSQFGRLHPGWPATLYRIAAMGKSHPISPIDSLNRRVEVVFYSHGAIPQAQTSIPQPPPQQQSPPPLTDRPDTTGRAKIDTVITLTQIYFIENTPLFTEASQQALPSVMAYLKKYQTRTMRVLGYVNSPGALLDRNDRLFILSTKRAQAVYTYMLAEGFDSRRLTFQGMGNSVMIRPHPMSLAEMRENMRVEIEIDKE
jgi:outer membrane protein OmpA-like peptidoglycan-associated protein